MGETVLTFEKVSKRYKDKVAIDDLSFIVNGGGIYALLGENGAGKTTLMDLVTGVSFPDEGVINLFGETESGRIDEARSELGCLIEAPALIANMSVYDNLDLQRLACRVPGKYLTEELLQITGLSDARKQKVKTLSLGMRQRLGIAMSIMGWPKLLLLDEPFNGLDPAGIQDIRNLLITINKQYGTTMLITSHILSEVYQLATEYLFISHGKLVMQLDRDELSRHCRRYILLKMSNVTQAISVIERTLHTDDFRVMQDGAVRLFVYLDDLELVSRTMADNGIYLTRLSIEQEPLDEFFLSVVGGAQV